MSETVERAADRDPIERALAALASAIRLLHKMEATGDLAALRRMDPEHPEAMAFARLSVLPPVGRLIEDMAINLGQAEALRRVAAVSQVMALRADGLRPWGLGRELDQIGMTGHRLGALLTARDMALRDIVRRLARRLARDGDALAYEDLGKLLILSGWREEAAEETRMKIAREVARAERDKERTSPATAA